MMTRHEVQTERAPVPGSPYSQGVRIGSLVAVSGQLGFDPESRELVTDEITGQTRQALANVEAVLAASGATLDDVLKVSVFIADFDDFQAMNEAYRGFFAEPRPARTTVVVGLLPGAKVEIDAIAVIPDAQAED